MLKSLWVVLLVLCGLNFALAEDWKILTNGSEYRVSKESASFTETPYTIQDGLELTKKEIADFIANKKDVYSSKFEIIHSTFNKWYTHETITREYQGYGFGKDNRIERKSIKEEVEVFNPVLYLAILGLLFLMISTWFKSKALRLEADNTQVNLSKEELVNLKKDTLNLASAFLFIASLVTFFVAVFNSHIDSSVVIILEAVGVVFYYLWCDSRVESLFSNFVGMLFLVIFFIAVVF